MCFFPTQREPKWLVLSGLLWLLYGCLFAGKRQEKGRGESAVLISNLKKGGRGAGRYIKHFGGHCPTPPHPPTDQIFGGHFFFFFFFFGLKIADILCFFTGVVHDFDQRFIKTRPFRQIDPTTQWTDSENANDSVFAYFHGFSIRERKSG